MSDTRKPMITDLFLEGARKGWTISINSTMPSVMMAFVLIKILQLTGILDFIGIALNPLMVIFGVPGEAATILLASWLSMAGGVGVTIALFTDGVLNNTQVAIMAPAIFLVGSQIQYIGRIMGPIGTEGRHIPIMIAISFINAFGAMFLMNIIV